MRNWDSHGKHGRTCSVTRLLGCWRIQMCGRACRTENVRCGSQKTSWEHCREACKGRADMFCSGSIHKLCLHVPATSRREQGSHLQCREKRVSDEQVTLSEGRAEEQCGRDDMASKDRSPARCPHSTWKQRLHVPSLKDFSSRNYVSSGADVTNNELGP